MMSSTGGSSPRSVPPRCPPWTFRAPGPELLRPWTGRPTGRRWTVKTDVSPSHVVDASAAAAVRGPSSRLVVDGKVRDGASAGPEYVLLNDVAGAQRARELAAAVHAAMYGDLTPLARAVPQTRS